MRHVLKTMCLTIMALFVLSVPLHAAEEGYMGSKFITEPETDTIRCWVEPGQQLSIENSAPGGEVIILNTQKKSVQDNENANVTDPYIFENPDVRSGYYR